MTDPGITRCEACSRILSAVNEDTDWPGFCNDCVLAGTPALRVLRKPDHKRTTSRKRETSYEYRRALPPGTG